MLESKLCECGCGGLIKPGNRFINGHNFRVLSPEQITKKHVALKGPKSLEYKVNMKKVMNCLDVKITMSVAHTGVLLSPEHCKTISAGQMADKNHNWQGGISLIYHPNFNSIFCRKIRKLHNNICQICGKTNEQNINETTQCLEVHHIYYDPETNDCSNLEDFITLCKSCHCKTTFGNHEYWENYFIMNLLLVA